MANVTAHRELDEVRAPESLPTVAVKAGDRGVVVDVFERPRPAVRVEYADGEGQTKALVTYSSDFTKTLEVIPERA